MQNEISLSLVRGEVIIGEHRVSGKGEKKKIIAHARTGYSEDKHGLGPTVWMGEVLFRRLSVRGLAQVMLEEGQHILKKPAEPFDLEKGTWKWINLHGSIAGAEERARRNRADPQEYASLVIEHDREFIASLDLSAPKPEELILWAEGTPGEAKDYTGQFDRVLDMLETVRLGVSSEKKAAVDMLVSWQRQGMNRPKLAGRVDAPIQMIIGHLNKQYFETKRMQEAAAAFFIELPQDLLEKPIWHLIVFGAENADVGKKPRQNIARDILIEMAAQACALRAEEPLRVLATSLYVLQKERQDKDFKTFCSDVRMEIIGIARGARLGHAVRVEPKNTDRDARARRNRRSGRDNGIPYMASPSKVLVDDAVGPTKAAFDAASGFGHPFNSLRMGAGLAKRGGLPRDDDRDVHGQPAKGSAKKPQTHGQRRRARRSAARSKETFKTNLIFFDYGRVLGTQIEDYFDETAERLQKYSGLDQDIFKNEQARDSFKEGLRLLVIPPGEVEPWREYGLPSGIKLIGRHELHRSPERYLEWIENVNKYLVLFGARKKVTQDEFEDAYFGPMTPNPWIKQRLNDLLGIKALLNIKYGVISNFEAAGRPWIMRLLNEHYPGLIDEDLVVITGENGAVKSDGPMIFDRALSRFRQSYGEPVGPVFIDNQVSEYVAGAAEAGIKEFVHYSFAGPRPESMDKDLFTVKLSYHGEHAGTRCFQTLRRGLTRGVTKKGHAPRRYKVAMRDVERRLEIAKTGNPREREEAIAELVERQERGRPKIHKRINAPMEMIIGHLKVQPLSRDDETKLFYPDYKEEIADFFVALPVNSLRRSIALLLIAGAEDVTGKVRNATLDILEEMGQRAYLLEDDTSFKILVSYLGRIRRGRESFIADEQTLAREALDRIPDPREIRANLFELQPETQKNPVYPEFQNDKDIEQNAEKTVPLLVNAFKAWAGSAALVAVDSEEDKKEELVLFLDAPPERFEKTKQLVERQIIKLLTSIDRNNPEIKGVLENLSIVGRDRNGLEKVRGRVRRGRLKSENIIVVTHDTNIQDFGEDPDGFNAFENAFITALDIDRSFHDEKNYYPYVEVVFFALLRKLGALESHNSREKISKYKKRLWRWYKQIPNIECIDKRALINLCFDGDDPRRVVVLRLISRHDYEDLERVYDRIREFITKA